MSQGKVTQFFKVQKGNPDMHASKRIKLEVASPVGSHSDSVTEIPERSATPISQRTRSRGKSSHTAAQMKSKRCKIDRRNLESKNQKKMSDLLKLVPKIEEKTPENVRSETTAACDDHCGSPCRPTKRLSDKDSEALVLKRSRDNDAVRKDLLKDFEGDGPPRNPQFKIPQLTVPERFDFGKTSPPEYQTRSTVEMTQPSTPAYKKYSFLLASQPDLTVSKPKTVPTTSPFKKDTPSAPAYKKNLHLATHLTTTPQTGLIDTKAEPTPTETSSTPAPGLVLPNHFKQLLRKFENLDTVVSILHKRNEICTFSKVKAGVQQGTGKTFTEHNLGQIAAVYPTAYTYRQEKVGNQYGPRDTCRYQLTLEAQLEEILGFKPKVDKNGRPQFSAIHLLARKQTFLSNLLSIVKKDHKSFLSSLSHPLSIPDRMVTRWHPKFILDQVPEVKASLLPQPPNQGKKLASAREVLEAAKSNLNARIQRTLDLLHSPSVPTKMITPSKVGPPSKVDFPANITHKEKAKSSSSTKVNSPAKSSRKPKVNKVPEDSSLKGIPASLLEKIRAKQARREEAAIMRSAEDEARTQRLERLPELARILRTYFVTQKKPALLLVDVVNKLSESYRTNLGKAETEKHLSLLQEVIPNWLEVVVIKRGTYVKLDKRQDITAIVNRLQMAFQKAL